MSCCYGGDAAGVGTEPNGLATSLYLEANMQAAFWHEQDKSPSKEALQNYRLGVCMLDGALRFDKQCSAPGWRSSGSGPGVEIHDS